MERVNKYLHYYVNRITKRSKKSDYGDDNINGQMLQNLSQEIQV